MQRPTRSARSPAMRLIVLMLLAILAQAPAAPAAPGQAEPNDAGNAAMVPLPRPRPAPGTPPGEAGERPAPEPRLFQTACPVGVTTDCAMASMLPVWLGRVDGYLQARSRHRLEGVTVGTSFMCRTRRTGGPDDTPSEHGFADALDVTGFTLDDGRTVTVGTGWIPAASEDGRLLRFAHDAACSLFTTTLGPEANALHRDHFHLDMGCHGAACTYGMCE